MFTAWLYWDPDPTFFTLPFLDLSIRWYGLLFASGFIAGYFLMICLFSRKILVDGVIAEGHVSDWSRLLYRLQTALEGKEASALREMTAGLKPSEKIELERYKRGEQPSETLKSAALRVIQEKINANRPLDSDLYETLCALKKTQSLVHFALKSQDATFRPINRLIVDRLFPLSLTPVQAISSSLADKLCWFTVLGTVLGARLGHVLFYNFDYFLHHPLEILNIRAGGLASHGGTVGVIIFMYFFIRVSKKQLPQLDLLGMLDLLVIPSALTAFCIRIGNFMNQEILGTETTVPWAVIFGHPVDGSAPVPRHPVQLYEAFGYLVIFFGLFAFSMKSAVQTRKGVITGLFFLCAFGWRFITENYKDSLGGAFLYGGMETGQVLSLPFIVGALLVLLYAYCSKPALLYNSPLSQ